MSITKFTLALGCTSLLEVSLQAPATTRVVGNLPTGNTTANQIANQNVNVAGPCNVSAEDSGLVGAVTVKTVTKLDRPFNGIIASPFPSVGSHNRFATPSTQNHQETCVTFGLVKPLGKS